MAQDGLTVRKGIVGVGCCPRAQFWVVQVHREHPFLPGRCHHGMPGGPYGKASPVEEQVVVATDLVGQQEGMLQHGCHVASDQQAGLEFL